MLRMTRRTLTAALAATGVALGAAAAAAQDFPSKPITMIIPLGAGGSHDLNARVMTSVLSGYLGQPVVIQLMPGGSGRIGTSAAAKAKADGYTLLFTHNFIDILQQHVSKLPYNSLKDFVPVARTNYAPASIAVRADSKYKTLKEMLDDAKAHPNKVKFGHSGNWGAAMVPGVCNDRDLLDDDRRNRIVAPCARSHVTCPAGCRAAPTGPDGWRDRGPSARFRPPAAADSR